MPVLKGLKISLSAGIFLMLSGCIVGEVVGGAVDITTSAVGGVIDITGAALDVVIPGDFDCSDCVSEEDHEDALDEAREEARREREKD